MTDTGSNSDRRWIQIVNMCDRVVIDTWSRRLRERERVRCMEFAGDLEAAEVSKREGVSMTGIVRRCIAASAAAFGVQAGEIMGRRRTRRVARARQAAMFLARRRGFSFPRLGRIFQRDHKTILHDVRVASRVYDADPAFALAVELADASVEQGYRNYSFANAARGVSPRLGDAADAPAPDVAPERARTRKTVA